MKRNLATRSLHTRNRLAQPRQPSLSDPNELESLIGASTGMDNASARLTLYPGGTKFSAVTFNLGGFYVDLLWFREPMFKPAAACRGNENTAARFGAR